LGILLELLIRKNPERQGKMREFSSFSKKKGSIKKNRKKNINIPHRAETQSPHPPAPRGNKLHARIYN
jgi:hypothetical protein